MNNTTNNKDVGLGAQSIVGGAKKKNQNVGLIENTDKIMTKVEQLNVFSDKQSVENIFKQNKKNIPSKGNLLEYRLKRLLFSMGYFPKIGIVLKTSQNEQADMITDLDVYGVYIHKNFTSKTIWADCKSGQARPLERISWINGIKSIIEVDDIIFVKRNVRQSTKEFARKSGIQVLDLTVIEKLEKDYNIDADDWRGSWNPETQISKLLNFQKIDIPNNETFKKIGSFINSGYWGLDEYTKIKKTITALRQLAEVEQLPLSFEQLATIRWAIFELVTLFVLATFNITKEIYYFSNHEKRDTIANGLISGEISPQKRAEIVEATYKVAYSIIQKQIPNYQAPLKVPNLGMSPPRYFEAFYDLILRITDRPLDYFDLLRFLDFIFMEYDIQNQKIDDSLMKNMFNNYDNLIISAKTILHFICGETRISRQLFQLLR